MVLPFMAGSLLALISGSIAGSFGLLGESVGLQLPELADLVLVEGHEELVELRRVELLTF